MRKRDTQVTIAAALGAGLLGLVVAPAMAQPVDPARPTAASSAAPEAAAPAAAAGRPAVAAPAAPADQPAVLAPAPAAAPAGPGKPAAGKPAVDGKTALPDGASIKVERTSSGAKLFRITEGLLVEGQMQRPNAFLVLQRATVDYDYEALSESFLPRIIAAAREKPF
jgi:nucleoid-associated protein YgaU